MNKGDGLEAQSEELQRNIDRLASQLGVQSMPVGLRTNDDLNIYVDADGYHYAYWERGRESFDRVGSLDDVLYWYCEGEVSNRAPGGQRQRFQYKFDVLSGINPEWGKRSVRGTAAKFRDWGVPEDISLLPDIGEPL